MDFTGTPLLQRNEQTNAQGIMAEFRFGIPTGLPVRIGTGPLLCIIVATSPARSGLLLYILFYSLLRRNHKRSLPYRTFCSSMKLNNNNIILSFHSHTNNNNNHDDALQTCPIQHNSCYHSCMPHGHSAYWNEFAGRNSDDGTA